ncbi:MAG TPA: CoA transferase [Streptosporangiaceae bacterium]|nr:CoA transferase [Streptosporangiaceae bacterium]
MAKELWARLLGEAWAALGGGESGTELQVTGVRGSLPSHLPVEDTAIACAGAALLAAADLQAQRGGPVSRTARLDRGHVAAAFRSEAYLRLNGAAAGAGFAPLSRFWPARDGWVRTHGNYPWHREALVRALGTGEDPDQVAAAIAGRAAHEVEDLVVGAGGVAAAVRTEAQWRAEPAGQAVAAARLVEGGRVSQAPARRRAAGALAVLPAGALPAAGIRVLDLTRVIAGPVATRYLAALGADVLRLDPPHRPELPHAYDGLLGKRSALLDLDLDGARFDELLGAADVLVHGYRPHALERFGFTPAALAERHPGLVVVSLSAWGSAGPWGGRRGFDSIVQAASGIAVAESAGGDRPGAMPCQLLDHGTGYLCAAAALRGLADQAVAGGTQVRELSLARTAQWLLSSPTAGLTPTGSTGASGGRAGGDADWLTTLGSPEGAVTVVRPLGQLDGRELAWPAPLTRYGGDPPAWR